MSDAIAQKTRKSAKYLELRDILRKFIESNPPGTRLPSYAEMIRQYEVGQITIDRALREFDEQQLIIRKHGQGIFTSERVVQTNIGIVFGRDIYSSFSSPVYRFLVPCVERRAQEFRENASFFLDVPQVKDEDFGIFVCRDLLDTLKSGRLQGLLLFSPRGPREIEWLNSFGVPLVTHTNGASAGCSITLEGVERRGVEILAREGCKRIGLLTLHGHQRDQGYFADLNSFRAALSECGLEYRPEDVWDHAPKPDEKTHNSESNEILGYKVACELLGDGAKPRFDGLVSNDDVATRGFLARMREIGMEPGRDLKIATHVNRGVPVFLGYENSLFMLEVDPEQLIVKAFEVLNRMIEGEKIPSGTVITV